VVAVSVAVTTGFGAVLLIDELALDFEELLKAIELATLAGVELMTVVDVELPPPRRQKSLMLKRQVGLSILVLI
jgi:hypothetical protein